MADTLIIFATACGLAMLAGWVIERMRRPKEDEWRNEYDNDWE